MAGDHGAGTRRAAAGGVRGDFAHRGLPAVSAERLGKADHVIRKFSDRAGAGDCRVEPAEPVDGAGDLRILCCGAGDYFRIELQHRGVAATECHAGRNNRFRARPGAQGLRWRAQIVRKDHHREAGDDDQRRDPAERVGQLPLFGRRRRPIRHDFADQKTGDEPARVRPVVDSWKEQSPYADVNQPADQLPAQHLHARTAPARRDGQKHADQAYDCAGAADAEMSERAAEDVSADSGDNVNEEITSGTVEFLDLRANVHQHPHVETDVEDAAVKENGGDESPRLHQII